MVSLRAAQKKQLGMDATPVRLRWRSAATICRSQIGSPLQANCYRLQRPREGSTFDVISAAKVIASGLISKQMELGG
jgi:hypothetical protein